MARLISALAAGMIFGIGIVIAGMSNPAKILNFFDVAGSWDPSLALVMAAALAVTVPGYRLAFRRKAPLFDAHFHLPKAKAIDVPLLAGSAVFGIGWGITGFCPGGSIPALGLMQGSAALFVAAMVGGILLARAARRAFAGRAALS